MEEYPKLFRHDFLKSLLDNFFGNSEENANITSPTTTVETRVDPSPFSVWDGYYKPEENRASEQMKIQGYSEWDSLPKWNYEWDMNDSKWDGTVSDGIRYVLFVSYFWEINP